MTVAYGCGKPIYKRWWFWVLVVAISGVTRGGGASRTEPAGQRTAPAATYTVREQADPEPVRQAPEQTKAPVSQSTIRPEVKEFLDSYEACMNEYVDFMKKYQAADPEKMLSMMDDYFRILEQYTDYAEKLDELDESDFTDAELAYYTKVTLRVEKKLLSMLE